MTSNSRDDANVIGQMRRQWQKPSFKRLSAGAAENQFAATADALGGLS
jgi:hypothetical protein